MVAQNDELQTIANLPNTVAAVLYVAARPCIQCERSVRVAAVATAGNLVPNTR